MNPVRRLNAVDEEPLPHAWGRGRGEEGTSEGQDVMAFSHIGAGQTSHAP
jgi:hypothetical protein